jgi:hypothetical protein
LVLARVPNGGELNRLKDSLAFFRDHFQSDAKAAGELISQGNTPAPRDIAPAELAAYTAVASLILNLDEAVTKE